MIGWQRLAKRIGGTMPEDLPTPSKSAKQIEKEYEDYEKQGLLNFVDWRERNR